MPDPENLEDLEDLEILARKYALQNALEHGGRAAAGSVIGRMMNKAPEYRDRPRDVAAAANAAVGAVNAMGLEEQKKALETLAPELLERRVRERNTGLPDLENADEHRGVVMRLAPNPSGPLHIGHTRMAILNDEYVRRYGGKLIVRMEDTNPPTILPEAYDMITEDLDWLGVEYHEVVRQSDRFELYYRHAAEILARGKGYMCTCPPDDWRALKEAGRGCPHRDTGPETNLELWERMLAGDFSPGEISMMVKTDLAHPNPAVRDFVAMRLVDEPHPLTGTRYRVYPLYNFSVAVDDHEMGMTHVLRGKDHLNNTLRQEYVYEHLGWPKPVFIHYGWVSIDGLELSTRKMRAAIAAGEYEGWDDPRLGTVRALARRGIRPEAIRRYWLEVGTKAVDIRFSWENLYAMNRDIVDPEAARLFFVPDPVPVDIAGAPALRSRAPLHPDRPEMGYRGTALTPPVRVNVPAEDLAALPPGGILRLKDMCNIRMTDQGAFTYAGNDLAVLKHGARIVQWVGPDALDAEVRMPDGSVISGMAEPAAAGYDGRVVQFERFGFVRLEVSGGVTAFFAHK